MRRSLVIAVLLAAIGWGGSAFAQRKDHTNSQGQPLGSNPHPVTWTSTQPKPAPPSPPPKKAAHPASQHPGPQPRREDERHHRGGHDHIIIIGNDDEYGYPYEGYSPYYYPMPIYARMAGRQFMGQNGAGQFQPNGGWVAPGGPDADDVDPPRRDVVRTANARVIAQAWKSIGYGDALFAKMKYAEASDRYRMASNSAPQLADAWFRRAIAQTAIGSYSQAVNSIKRGLGLDPKWPKTVFDTGDILWPNAAAKTAYFNSLVKRAAEKPTDANIQFLVGLHYHIDGQEVLAQKYFARAQRLAGNNIEHIVAFSANDM
jgi:hypothetical protein